MQNTSYGGSMAAQIVSDDLAYCQENTPALAGAAGTQAVDQAKSLFSTLESAGAKIGAIIRDSDLTRDAQRKRTAALYDQAVSTAQAGLNGLDKTLDDFLEKQQRLSTISTPQYPTIADRESVLGNARADLKMVWDSADDTKLPEVMLASLREAVQNNDLNTIYLLCGQPDFARKYAATRRAGDLMMQYFNGQAGQIIEPILDTTTRNAREALKQEQSCITGSISWLRQTMEVYRNGRLRELRNMAGL